MKIGNFIITFNKVKPKQKDVLHSLNKKLIEYSFNINGIDYYTFKNFLDFPPLRHAKINHFLREIDMAITADDLKDFLKSITGSLNEGNLNNAIKTLAVIEYQLNTYSDLDILYRLCSAVFFDLGEDISSYDYDYNENKIKAFKSQLPKDFFLMKSVSELFPQINISEESIQTFLVAQSVAKEYRKQMLSANTLQAKI
jgi:hypothetical protein